MFQHSPFEINSFTLGVPVMSEQIHLQKDFVSGLQTTSFSFSVTKHANL